MPATQRILFLTDDREDYLADSLLHGLISLGSHEVVDYPKKELLYQGAVNPSNCKQIYGNGFTLYGLLPDRGADRSLIWKRLEEGYFGIVILSNIWRQFGLLAQVSKFIQSNRARLVLLDGDDDPRLYPVSTTRIKEHGINLPWHGARVPAQSFYFKRELSLCEPQQWLELLLPTFVRPWLRSHLDQGAIKPIPCSFSIPKQWIRKPNRGKKHKLLPTHVVDAEVRECFQLGSSNYAFLEQTDYFDDLAQSRFGITTKRAGWDCLRHYEIAAAGTVPCFRDLNKKPVECSPHGLNTSNCIAYHTAEDLAVRLSAIDDSEYDALLQASHQWVLEHTTTREAERFLDQLES